MIKLFRFIGGIVFLSTLFLESSSNCGCNQIKRSEIEMVKNKENKDNSVNEMCSNPANESNLMSLMHEFDDMTTIPEGEYIIGTNDEVFPKDRESPERIVYLKQFSIDKYEVSNSNFARFIQKTNYKTYAEKFGDSFIFKGQMSIAMQTEYDNYRVVNAPWWFKVNHTNWEHPEGKDSTIENRMDHPVVHVSWFDAKAYCEWKNKRLPTESEWEVACRGGKKCKLYPWGNKLMAKNKHWANIWQGTFPNENSEEDGYKSTCPVDQFLQNDYDLYNIVGNVWEWTDTSWDEINNSKLSAQQLETVERVKKGGSYLCHKSYCYRYRCAARSSNTADSSAGNLGFRCAQSQPMNE